jgi:hypothetical protein
MKLVICSYSEERNMTGPNVNKIWSHEIVLLNFRTATFKPPCRMQKKYIYLLTARTAQEAMEGRWGAEAVVQVPFVQA